MPSLRLPDIGSQLEPGNPTPGAHTTGALGHASMLAAPASGRVAVLAPRRQARRVVARRRCRARVGRGGERATNPAATTAPSTPKRASLALRGRDGAPRSERRSHAPRSPPGRGRPAPAVADAGVGAARLSRLATRARIEARRSPRSSSRDRRGRVPHRGRQPPPPSASAHGLVRRGLIAGNAAGIRSSSPRFTPNSRQLGRDCTIPSSRVFSTGCQLARSEDDLFPRGIRRSGIQAVAGDSRGSVRVAGHRPCRCGG